MHEKPHIQVPTHIWTCIYTHVYHTYMHSIQMKKIIKKTRFRRHMCSSCVGGGSNRDTVSGPLLLRHAFPLMSPRNSPTRWPGFHIRLSCWRTVWPLACCLLKTQLVCDVMGLVRTLPSCVSLCSARLSSRLPLLPSCSFSSSSWVVFHCFSYDFYMCVFSSGSW